MHSPSPATTLPFVARSTLRSLSLTIFIMKFILALVVVLLAGVPAVGHAEEFFVEQANAVRSVPVVYSEDLSARASVRAQSLCNAEFSHAGWTSSFAGSSYKFIGENLARGFTHEQDVQAAWMLSPTHKANIVASKFTHMGVGRSTCGVIVELFASV